MMTIPLQGWLVQPISMSTAGSSPAPSRISPTRRRSDAAAAWSGSRGTVRMEDLLYGTGEEARQRDRQRQGRGVPAGFDGVDGLPGHPHGVGELGLRQVAGE